MITERMSAMFIFQNLVLVRSLQEALASNPNDAARRQQLEGLQEVLKPQIEAWSGISAIDSWIDKNDPGHNKPSEIEGINWRWL